MCQQAVACLVLDAVEREAKHQLLYRFREEKIKLASQTLAPSVDEPPNGQHI
jgi:hypothetical protein